MGMKHRYRCADAYVRERLHEKMKNRGDTTESEKATSVMESENSESGMREALARDQRYGKPVVVAGIVLIAMELWKQLTLWLLVEGGQYNVWYFPFQLCSLPMYLALLYGMLRKRTGRRAFIIKRALLTFLQDYGFLGGALALIVHVDGSWLHLAYRDAADGALYSCHWTFGQILSGIPAYPPDLRHRRRPRRAHQHRTASLWRL